jgi:hypothetical protein
MAELFDLATYSRTSAQLSSLDETMVPIYATSSCSRTTRDMLTTTTHDENRKCLAETRGKINIIGHTEDINVGTFWHDVDNLGGHVVFAPLEETIKNDDNTSKWQICVTSADCLIPICHEGQNRSQIMHLAASGFKRIAYGSSDVTVALPHGAESGFDAYQGYADLTPDNVYTYIYGIIHPLSIGKDCGDWIHVNFKEAFGVEKAKRIGQHYAESSGTVTGLNPSQLDPDTLAHVSRSRTQQRAHMDDILYDADVLRSYAGPSGRVIILCFCRATGIFLQRLLEVNKARGKRLDNIYVVSLPFVDRIARAGGSDEIAAHLARTGELLTRDELNIQRHIEIYKFYGSIFTSPTPL